MKLDYSEEEVRSVNLTRSSSPNCTQRQDTGQGVWSWVWMQWMTITSLVPCSTTRCCIQNSLLVKRQIDN